ncbi:HNH endonuclease [Paenibacillus rhizophilus]|uniref:Putative HNH nuclease YajD n=1 Tax=Paenibacillus rhizophilus TaxID=1850366 RepID=A0A3N9P9V7_9BACL|nr:HNH endonuclease [Paenibacillus rhizophilus]RQW11834.1 HNH endonuclease [Paenibacillus rhizophilus]
MPLKKFCKKPGCKNLTDGAAYCADHQAEVQRYDKERGSAAERGYGHKWRIARARYLRQYPLCVHCEQAGRVTAATVVDHIIAHKGDMELFWDVSNWQSLCASCHGVKTVKEDGGFGNVVTGEGGKILKNL